MLGITRINTPDEALLKTFRGGAAPERWGHYTDCFCIRIPRAVSLEHFVIAFYGSWIFRLERLLLQMFLAAGSTQAQLRELARGSRAEFAVWYVGARSDSQLLMCDGYERTRSWLCVRPQEGGTELLFGSGLAGHPLQFADESRPATLRLLTRFHVLYSQLLLHAAARRLGA
jgi:hypothetical protein